MKKKTKKDKKSLIIIILLLLIIGLISYFGFFAKSDTDDTLAVDQTQSEYVKPEDPIDRSKNVSLPGWGSFTIPANTKKIDKGFEFHNPDTNFWYEDSIQYNGKELEKLVVDSGNKVELNHYLKLAGVNSEVKSVKSYNKKLFSIDKNDDGNYQLEAVGYTDKDIMPMPILAEDSQVTTLKYVVSAKVRYVTDNTTMDIADVQCEDTLKEPDNPQKDGYKFIGWQDEETGKFWDFNDAVERNVTLIARFEKISDKIPDKDEITNPETKKDTETDKSKINTGVQVNNAMFIVGICIAFAGIGFATYKLLKKEEN